MSSLKESKNSNNGNDENIVKLICIQICYFVMNSNCTKNNTFWVNEC